ncbi:hypothetical protein NL676_035482 [Syzygium grande]|nr:hypothetical protein NL676_035482 [Syzygium grande]
MLTRQIPAVSIGAIEHKVYTHVGPLGNSSDVYYGRTISLSLGNFWPLSDCFPPTSSSSRLTPSKVHRLQSEGYCGGVRLLMALCKLFRVITRITTSIFTEIISHLSYETSIPCQTGLSGSSAIVCAASNCLRDFYNVRHLVKVEVRSNLMLNAGKELNMSGDEFPGALNMEMTEVAQQVGAASKFTSSGGAAVAFYPDGPSQAKLLEDECRKAGFILKPIQVELGPLDDDSVAYWVNGLSTT